jgi:hypothetical protein
MVIINIPLSTIPALPGGPRDLAGGPKGLAVLLPAAGTASLTTAGAGAGMAAMLAITGNPGPERLPRIVADRLLTRVVRPLTGTGEDNC